MSEKLRPTEEVRNPRYYQQVIKNRILGQLALQEIAETQLRPPVLEQETDVQLHD